MPEQHPGLRTTEAPNDPTLPLRIVKVYPPTEEQVAQAQRPNSVAYEQGRYTVSLALSRLITDDERTAAEQLAGRAISRSRVYGRTLEISNTTVELIADQKDQISDLVKQIEAEGKRLADARAIREQREQEAQEAAATEAARLAQLAEQISFD